MPSPSTPRRASNRTTSQSTPSKAAATAAAAAALKSNTPASVKDRIRQWQEQQGGVAPLSPSLGAQSSISSLPSAATIDDPEPKITPKLSTKKQSQQVPEETTPKRSSAQKFVDPKNREWIREKQRSTSTPRKRVVSDDNWKKRYGSPREARSTPATPQPDATKRTPPRKASERAERRGRRSEGIAREREYKYTTANDDDDSVRVAATIPGSRNYLMEHDDIVVEIESTIPDSGRISPPVVFPKISPGSKQRPSRKSREKPNTPPEAEDDRNRRKSSYAEALEAPSESIETSSGKFGSLRSKAKQLFTKSDAAPVSAPRVPTIEAWLNETPDPFVDTNEPAVDVPAPLNTKPRRRKFSAGPEGSERAQRVLAEEDLADSPGKRDSDRRRRRGTRPSLDKENQEPGTSTQKETEHVYTPQRTSLADEREAAREMSPSTLRRRNARGHRSKSRPRSANIASGFQEPHSPETSSPITSPPAEDPFTDYGAKTRPFPPTGGHQLSTIASMETFSSKLDSIPHEDMLANGPNELKRRLTTNDDLMSVLSLPRTSSKKIRSARSIRTPRGEMKKESVAHILQILADDENKYMRELKTLVDGVIPVLLQCILSKSEMNAAAGLFGGLGTDNAAVTKPVMDMGIALERLKSLHKRVPLRDTESLLSWAQGAHKVYEQFIGSWRMGFQDVIVNLAPAEDEKYSESKSEGGMARDAEGDVIDSDGKKVDVAHLLKRPLVRLKHLAKVFQQLNEANPSSRTANVYNDYQNLVELARRRSNEERGRLEDEAAASIDPTKARDTRSLAIMTGVTIETIRRVKARDYFNLTLHHSSGQRIDCRVELLMRDNRSEHDLGGDLLLCEVDDKSRWLLFPPVLSQCLSARLGDNPGEIILMIRGTSPYGQEWHELLSLHNEDEQTCQEWVQMLGQDPMPPKLFRSQSFINRQKETSRGVNGGFVTSQLNRTPSPTDIEVPIGEPSVLSVNEKRRVSPSQMWFNAHNPPSSPRNDRDSQTPISTKRSSNVNRKPLPSQQVGTTSSLPASPETPHTPRGAQYSSLPSSPIPSQTTAERRQSRHEETTSTYGAPNSSRYDQRGVYERVTEHRSNYDSSFLPKSPEPNHSISPDDGGNKHERPAPSGQQRPGYSRATSSTPSKELPTLPRIRGNGPSSTTPLTDTIRDQWASLSGVSPQSSKNTSPNHRSPVTTKGAGVQHEEPPPPPAHKSPTPSQVSFSNTPKLKHKQSPRAEKDRRRRSSSPLKHEYAPSTASKSPSDSEDALSDSTSDTSDDDLEGNDIVGSLPLFTSGKRKSFGVPSSRPTLASTSLAPSESASQAPFRRVPAHDPRKSAKTIATAFYWSDKGSWNPIHPDECSIVVTPGLIEAFEMTAAHSGAKDQDSGLSSGSTLEISSSTTSKPLIGLELTPLVPLRRGTALDISIRSPPVEGSKFRSSNNIMLRSRNVEECDALYAMINHARINNPTYIALQNARPSYQPPVTFNTGSTQGARHSQSSKRSSTWFFGGGGNENKPSYRASSAPSGPSMAGASENSVGTISSAIRRLSGSSMFNISRSAVLKKPGGPGAGSASLYSSSSGGTGNGSGSSTPIPGIGSASMGGVNNLKIRLYIREDQTKWRDMGAARLTVLPGVAGPAPMSPDPSSTPGQISSPPLSASDQPLPLIQPSNRGPRLPSSTHSPHRIHGDGREKRILITSSKKTNTAMTLLDVCLGESCFERVARTGIAISVWEEREEGVAKEGGVVGGKGRLFMVQCGGEGVAGWVFGVV